MPLTGTASAVGSSEVLGSVGLVSSMCWLRWSMSFRSAEKVPKSEQEDQKKYSGSNGGNGPKNDLLPNALEMTAQSGRQPTAQSNSGNALKYFNERESRSAAALVSKSHERSRCLTDR